VILGVERGHHHAAHHSHEGHPHEETEVFDPGDMRNMGGLRQRMRTTFWVYLIGALALAGIPPLAGFFSKDEILAEGVELNITVYVLLAVAAFFTAFYMGRQVWMVFFGQARTEAARQAEESPAVMTLPLVALALLSLFGGALNLPGVHTFTDWLEHTFESFHLSLHPGEFNPSVALLSTALALAAIFLSWLLYGRKPLAHVEQPDPLKRFLGPLFTGMENKWWVDEIYGFLFIKRYQQLAAFLAEKVDWQFWHDWFHDSLLAAGFRGVARLLAEPIDLGIVDRFFLLLAEITRRLSTSLSRLQTGFVRNYALSVLMGVVIILSYLILR
jgi:NADH-quinone oxidoreductase subunit L